LLEIYNLNLIERGNMCDTFVILPEFTNDGSMFFAKNSDREPNEPHFIEKIPAKDYASDCDVKCTYISIPQVNHTHSILLCKPNWIWGAEMGINEFGVVIGNEAVFSKIKADKEPGLIGMDYLRLGLERGKSALEALQVITNLLEEFGQGGNCGLSHPFYYHNSYLIADKSEAWKLETVGKQWVAKKIQGFGSISNSLTIDSEWDLSSEKLIEFAKESGIYKKNGDLNFNFSKTYSDWLYTKFSDASKRRNCTLSQISSLSKNVQIGDIFRILRTHSEPEDKYSPDNGIMGSDICMHAGYGPIRGSQTTGSMAVQINDSINVWVTGSSAPCLSLFKPVSILQPGQLNNNVPARTFNKLDYWWQHELLHRRILQNYQHLKSDYQFERDAIERNFSEGIKNLNDDIEIFDFELKAHETSQKFLDFWNDKFESNNNWKNINSLLYKNAWNKFNNDAGLTL
jgi:dipeptidase